MTTTTLAASTAALHMTVAATDGVQLSLRAYGPADAPRLLVSHGNGMAADGYRVFWEPLARTFQVVALDMRNHGSSEGGVRARHTWSQFADDLESVWQALPRWLGERATVGVFHSLSAVASLHHLRRYGRRCDALLLFDPPIPPPEGHPLERLHHANMTELARGARARNPMFANPSVLTQKFARQSALKRWRAEAFEAMARAVMRQDPDAWRLSCPPELEAIVYETNTVSSLWATVCRSPVPIKIVGGDPDLPEAPASARMGRAAGAEFGVTYEALPDTTHFLQLERPETCQALTRDFVDRHARIDS